MSQSDNTPEHDTSQKVDVDRLFLKQQGLSEDDKIVTELYIVKDYDGPEEDQWWLIGIFDDPAKLGEATRLAEDWVSRNPGNFQVFPNSFALDEVGWNSGYVRASEID